MAFFDEKAFNAEAWGRYLKAVPNEKLNKLRSSGAITGDARLKELFASGAQTGTSYATIPYFGILGGAAQNYDGAVNLSPKGTNSYKQGVFTYGRMSAWTEADFSSDITGGVDFMANIRAQVIEYFNAVDQDALLAILRGVFRMTGAGSSKFKEAHIHDITAVGDGLVNATTLNTAIQKASGDHKHHFSLVITHSAVATNLENLNLLEYLKYTDAAGVTRDLSMGTWNGRIVVIDDGAPAEVISDPGGDYTEYTTYILGKGAISLEPATLKVPHEMARNPYEGGGKTTLIERRRNAVAVAGVSYTQASQASDSPTDAELATGCNWQLVQDSSNNYINPKLVPIAKIVSKG